MEGVNADGKLEQIEAPIIMGADGPNSIVSKVGEKCKKGTKEETKKEIEKCS